MLEKETAADGVVKRFGGWVLGIGVITIVTGLLAVLLPLATTLAVTVLLGALLSLAGVLEAVHAFTALRTDRFGLILLDAVIYLIAGVLLLAYPLQAAAAVALLVGIVLLIKGTLRVILALQVRGVPGWVWFLVSGVVTGAVGLLVLMHWPGSSAVVIGILVGVHLIFAGWAQVAVGQAMRRAGR
jgi:uncharacterized membrane protein HdeD (DUF308 family)